MKWLLQCYKQAGYVWFEIEHTEQPGESTAPYIKSIRQVFILLFGTMTVQSYRLKLIHKAKRIGEAMSQST